MESVKQDLNEIRKERNQFQNLHAAFTPGKRQPPRTSFGAEKYRRFALKVNAKLLSGIAVAIASVMVVWLSGSGRGIPDSLIGAERQITASTTPEVPAINDAAQVLRTQPLPAGDQIHRKVSVVKLPRQTAVGGTTNPRNVTQVAAAAASTPALLRIPDRAAPKVPASHMGTDGREGGQSSTREFLPTNDHTDKAATWAINLVSSSSKTDADRFAEKARSRGIQTQQQRAIVQGKEYWRVQIPGFSTAAEARTYAASAKEIMGLEDVWITKR